MLSSHHPPRSSRFRECISSTHPPPKRRLLSHDVAFPDLDLYTKHQLTPSACATDCNGSGILPPTAITLATLEIADESGQSAPATFHSVSVIRKVLARTSAFVKEVCQADLGDARAVNAYLDRPRSKDGQTWKRAEAHVSAQEWAGAQAEWTGFSRSNTPTSFSSAAQTPSPSTGAPPSTFSTLSTDPSPAAVAALLTEARSYHRARLIESYVAHLPKRLGKRSLARLATSTSHTIATRGDRWNAVVHVLRSERVQLATWRRTKARKGARRFFGGLLGCSAGVVEERPATPWLDAMDRVVAGLKEQEVCDAVKPEMLCAWVEAFIKAENTAFTTKEEVRQECPRGRGGRHDDKLSAMEELSLADEDCVKVGGRIDDLEEVLAFDTLAQKLVEDLALVQWVFDGEEAELGSHPDESSLLRNELQDVIERVRKEWFSLVFVQDACALDGQTARLPARVYKILSKKGQQEATKENDGSNCKIRKEWLMWDIEESDHEEDEE